MDTRDREAIDGLFDKLGEVERGAGPRDAEAERLIAERLQRQPGATYYMAQTIVMQDLALKNQAGRIEELERAAKAQPEASEGGGFFSGALAGGTPQPAGSRTSVPGVGRSGPWGQSPQPGAHSPMPAPEPYPQQVYPQQGFGGMGGRIGGMGGGGGGFLAGAAQTAMGVAGGVMLGNALGSMLGGHGGLFGGQEAAPEVTQNVTNNYDEVPQDDVREASDTTADDAGADPGYQDASYDDPGTDAGFGGDDGGFENI